MVQDLSAFKLIRLELPDFGGILSRSGLVSVSGGTHRVHCHGEMSTAHLILFRVLPKWGSSLVPVIDNLIAMEECMSGLE